jgi:hypothetical protein
VADANKYPLDNCLLRAKLLASRLPGQRFRQWVDAELDGYPDADAVPDYRRIRTQIFGNFVGMFGAQMRNVRLSVANWGADVRQELERFYFIDNVGSLQAMLDADTETFHNRLDIEFITLYRASGDVRVDGMVLQEAQRIFAKPAVRGVLHSIRNRLLDFLIELRERHPELDDSDPAATKIPEEDVSRIVDRRIYNNCSITDGSHDVTKQIVAAGGDINVGGHFVLAEQIDRSFKKAEGGPGDREVTALMRRLGDSVKGMRQALSEGQQREAAQNYDTLTSEASKAEPRREWVRLASEELSGTAKATGNTEILQLITRLRGHLGG